MPSDRLPPVATSSFLEAQPERMIAATNANTRPISSTPALQADTNVVTTERRVYWRKAVMPKGNAINETVRAALAYTTPSLDLSMRAGARYCGASTS